MNSETKSWLIAEMVKSRMKLRFHLWSRPTFSTNGGVGQVGFILERMKVGFWEWHKAKNLLHKNEM